MQLDPPPNDGKCWVPDLHGAVLWKHDEGSGPGSRKKCKELKITEDHMPPSFLGKFWTSCKYVGLSFFSC